MLGIGDFVLFGAVLIFAVGAGIWAILGGFKKRYEKPEYLQNLERVEDFSQFLSRMDDYLTWKERDALLELYVGPREFFENKSRFYRREGKVARFNEVFADLQKFADKYNAEFVARQKCELVTYFNDIEGKALDEQQREAVIVNEYSNLIVAGAGSGKTLTILGKVKYLTEKRGVKATRILLLSFTQKTVAELNERLEAMNIKARATTFHKLGYDYIKEFSDKAPVVANEGLLSKIVGGFLCREVRKDEVALTSFLNFAACYAVLPEEDEPDSLGEKLERDEGLNFETLKSRASGFSAGAETGLWESARLNERVGGGSFSGRAGVKNTFAGERVKSAEELMIANFLFLNGVDYKYEKAYPHGSRVYRPDFYLPDYDIWLEHFGVDENGRARWLSAFNGQKYLREMELKRARHLENGTKLLETYSYFNKNGELLEKLQEILVGAGVNFRPANKLALHAKIIENDPHFGDEQVKLVESFINLAKSRKLTAGDLRKLFAENAKKLNDFRRERQKLFLDFVLPIMEKYDEELRARNELDFNDMINLATNLVQENGLRRKFDYIIVDEYQDISVARFELIAEIRRQSEARLICVGDDWQSIYRFAGSDISLFADFEKFVGEYRELLIEQTYRNSQELIDVSAEFIQKNPRQIRKNPRSKKRLARPILYRRYEKGAELEVLLATLRQIVNKWGRKSSILVLARHAFDINSFLEQDADRQILRVDMETGVMKIKGMETANIKYITVHKSKGLEADNVVILNLRNEIYGFPNKRASDPLLSALLCGREDYAHAEERRLFYVALTRTKNETYLLLPGKESSFVKEIVKISGNAPGDEEKATLCPWCKTGELVARKSLKGGREFLGCSHYPKCRQTFSAVDILENPVLCPSCQSGFLVKREGAYGEFLGCTNYPRCKGRQNL